MRTFLIFAAAVVASSLIPASTALAQTSNGDGRAIYLKHCRTCHGTTGKPTKQALRENPKMPTLDAALLSKLSDDSLVAIVTNGKGEGMKPFKSKLSTAEIVAAAKYLRILANPPAPPETGSGDPRR